MMIKKISFCLLLAWIVTHAQLEVHAQQVLPEFSVIDRGGAVIIGWNNPHPDLSQLIIQKSLDSSKGFRSIMSMPDPTSFSNGYADKKPGANQYYYRIFYVRPGGRYAFTAAKKPMLIQNNPVATDPVVEKESIVPKIEAAEKVIKSVENKAELQSIKKIDSVVNANVFIPSMYVFTDKEGNLVIALPEAEKKKFSVHVFREDGLELFQIKNIKESQLLIDRSNFYHSGWFKFSLFDDSVLKEKNKFFIPPVGK